MRCIGSTVRGGRALIGAFLLGGMAIPGLATAQVSHAREVLNVLFVGNSQLFSNNLGDIVAGIAAADPLGPIIVPTMKIHLGETHDPTLAPALLEGNAEWDYVIFQELALLIGNIESPTLPIWPEPEREFVAGDVAGFHDAVRRLDGLARAKGAKTILFPSPPRRLARFDSDVLPVWKEIGEAHLAIARELGIDVAPIADAFEKMRQRLISVDPYMYDGSHPSAEGSYLEALVVYALITGRDPTGAPPLIYGRPISIRPVPDQLHRRVVNNDVRVPLVDMHLATAMELQRIAWEIVSQREKTASW
jgi:hypothetical protein